MENSREDAKDGNQDNRQFGGCGLCTRASVSLLESRLGYRQKAKKINVLLGWVGAGDDGLQPSTPWRPTGSIDWNPAKWAHIALNAGPLRDAQQEQQLPTIDIADCNVVGVSANRDARGCLFEIYRRSWDDAIPTVQWNACASNAGVVRGAHVHVDYDEFYTLPLGRVVLGLSDIRRTSPTYGKSAQIEWAAEDGFAVVIPRGVAHVVMFERDSVLAFGLSDYWNAEYDVVGCQWDDPELGFAWPARPVTRSERDTAAGTYQSMLQHYEERLQTWMAATSRHTS